MTKYYKDGKGKGVCIVENKRGTHVVERKKKIGYRAASEEVEKRAVKRRSKLLKLRSHSSFAP